MFVFDLSDTSYHFNISTTTNITLCLLSIFQVSVVAAATANVVVVVSLVFLLFFFRLSTAYFYKNYSVQITLCYYIFVITHFFKKVLQRSFFFCCNKHLKYPLKNMLKYIRDIQYVFMMTIVCPYSGTCCKS